MVHTCNPSYLGVWDEEDQGSRLTWANSSWGPPISKITTAKNRLEAQAIEHLLCKHEALSSSPSPTVCEGEKAERARCSDSHLSL
jgi:hypothetical protein